jgi:hypothetical protein
LAEPGKFRYSRRKFLASSFLLATAATSKDGHMIQISLEAVLLPQSVLEGGQHLVIHFQHLSALLADQVVMSPLAGQFVAYATLAQVNLADDVQLL